MECPPHSKESDRRNTVERDGDKSRSHRFSCGVAPSRERIESLNMNGAQKQHMKLEDLQANAAVRGILSDGLVTVVSVEWFGSEALELTYKTPTGRVANELLYRHDEPRLEILEVGRPWSFDGDGALFRLAHLFDPVLAVHTSVVEPLPHQMTYPHNRVHSLC